MVSAVVKVLETTTAMVVSGSSPFRARATSTGSTLARNLRVRPLLLSADGCASEHRQVKVHTPSLARVLASALLR